MADLRVEHYERENHGHFDDCDYVVILDKPCSEEDFEIAEKIAERLAICDSYHYEHEHSHEFFVTHA